MKSPDFSDGVMIALKVPAGTAARLAYPGGLEPDDLHCTLAYLGSLQDLSEEQQAGIMDAAQEVAKDAYPLEGSIPKKVDVFPAGDDGTPFWADPGTPAIHNLRERLMSSLESRGLDSLVSTDHDFNPHVTLGYLEDGESAPSEYNTPEEQPVTWNELLVSMGPDDYTFPLGNPTVTDEEDGQPAPIVIPPQPTPVAPVAPVYSRITPDVERQLARDLESHNASGRLGQRTTLEALRAVYLRGANETATAGLQASARASQGLTRVQAFLRSLTASGQADGPDRDLCPQPPIRSSLHDVTVMAESSHAFPVLETLQAAALYPTNSPSQRFQLNRALALAASSPVASVRASLPDRLRALIADGNSSAARSLRARRQLRDRYGRWIEEGGGVRFKLRIPGAPGGGSWFHGTVVGQNVPQGVVNVRLDDGTNRIVAVPHDKLEQPLALIRTDPSGVGNRPQDRNAPEVKSLTDPAPDNQGDPPTFDEVKRALADANRELSKRVGDDSTEAHHRDALVKAADDAVATVNNAQEMRDHLAALSEYADGVARGNQGRMTPKERDAFRGYAEDLQDIAASQAPIQPEHPDLVRARLDQQARAPKPVPSEKDLKERGLPANKAPDQPDQPDQSEPVDTATNPDDLLPTLDEFDQATQAIQAAAQTTPEDSQAHDRLAAANNVVANVGEEFLQGRINALEAMKALQGARDEIDTILSDSYDDVQNGEDDLTDAMDRIDGLVHKIDVWNNTPDVTTGDLASPEPTPVDPGDHLNNIIDLRIGIDDIWDSNNLRGQKDYEGLIQQVQRQRDQVSAGEDAKVNVGGQRDVTVPNLLAQKAIAEYDEHGPDFPYNHVIDNVRGAEIDQRRADLNAPSPAASPDAPDAPAEKLSPEDALKRVEDAITHERDFLNREPDFEKGQGRDFQPPSDEAHQALDDVEAALNKEFDTPEEHVAAIREALTRYQDALGTEDAAYQLEDALNQFADANNVAAPDPGPNPWANPPTPQKAADPNTPAVDAGPPQASPDEIQSELDADPYNAERVQFEDARADYENNLLPDNELAPRMQRLMNDLEDKGDAQALDLRDEIRQWFNNRVPQNQPLNVGDWVDVGGAVQGQLVDEIPDGYRVRTPDGQEINVRARTDQVRHLHPDEIQQLGGNAPQVGGEQDQFGNVVPGIMQLDRELNMPGGGMVQYYHFADDPDVESGVDIAVGNRRGRPSYVVRYNNVSRSNHDNWDDAVTAANAERERVGKLNVEAQARNEAQAQRRAEEDRVRAEQNANRNANNLDEADRPLPEGWTRRQVDEHRAIMEGPGRYRAFSDEIGQLHLMVRDAGGNVAQIGTYNSWDDLQQAMNEDRPRRAAAQRDEFGQWLAGHGFSEDTVGRFRAEPDPQAAQQILRADPRWNEMSRAAEDAAYADRQNPDERRAANNWTAMVQGIRNIEPLETPDVPAGGERRSDALNPEQMQVVDSIIADVEQHGEQDIADYLHRIMDEPGASLDDPSIDQTQREGIRDEIIGRANAALDQGRLSEDDARGLAKLADQIFGQRLPNDPNDGLVQPMQAPTPDPVDQAAGDIIALSDEIGGDLGNSLAEVGNSVQDGQFTPEQAAAHVAGMVQFAPPEHRQALEDLIKKLDPNSAYNPDAQPAPAAPAAPEAPAAPAAPEAPTAPGAPPGQEGRYHPDGVIQDAAGRQLKRGDRVYAHRDGIEGEIIAVQQQPPYARVRMDDGRVVVRAGGRLQHRPAQGQQEPPRPDPARRPPVRGEQVIAQPDPANVPEPPPLEDILQNLYQLREAIPRRIGVRGHRDPQQVAQRNAGFAIDDARAAILADNNLAEARRHLVRAVQGIGFGNPGADEISQQIRALEAHLGIPQADAPGAPRPTGRPAQAVTGRNPEDWLEPRPSGNYGGIALDPNTPGVQRPGPVEPDPNSAYPAATVRDFEDFGDRAAEIALAAKTRPSVDSIFDTSAGPALLHDRVARVFDADGKTVFGNDGFTVAVNHVTSGLHNGAPMIVATFDVRDSTGRRIPNSSLVRQIRQDDQGNWYVYNDYMAFPPSRQGSGFAQAWNRNVENWAIANGMKEMRVTAGLDKGGAVWALQGFDWDEAYYGKIPETTVDGLLRGIERKATTDAERAQVAHLRGKLEEAVRTNNRDLVPTPLELALVGWRPGASEQAGGWAGVNGLLGKSWHGSKKLTPSHHSFKQREGYARAREAAARVRNNENIAEVSDNFVNDLRNNQLSIPGLTDVERNELVNVLSAKTSLAGLTPATKRKLSAWARDNLNVYGQEPGAFQDKYNLLRALRGEEAADSPGVSFGPGQELLDGLNLKIDPGDYPGDERATWDSIPGWTITPLSDRGVNITLKAVHDASGQTFYVKNDAFEAGAAGPRPDGAGAAAEADVNRLLRGAGWHGIGEARASTDPNTPDLVIQQRVGDNVDLTTRPVNAGAFPRDEMQRALHSLANPDELLRMWLLDLALGNADRHNANWQMARDQDGRYRIFPIDHGLAGSGQNWYMDQYDLFTRAGMLDGMTVYQYMRDVLQVYGKDNTETMLRAAIADYRKALADGEGQWIDGRFRGNIEATLQRLEDQMTRALRKWF